MSHKIRIDSWENYDEFSEQIKQPKKKKPNWNKNSTKKKTNSKSHKNRSSAKEAIRELEFNSNR